MENKEAVEKILNIRVSYTEAIQGIAEYQKKIDALKEREKALALELKAGKVTRAEYRKEVAAIKEATKEYQGEIRILSKEIQDDIKLQKQQEGSIAQLRKMLSDAKAAYVAMSKAERESAKGKDLQQHILSLNNEIKDMEAEIGVFSRNVGNYEEAIKNALGVNNTFGNSLLNMVKSGGGIKGMFTEASASAKAFLSTLTGFLSNPVFLGIAGIAGAGAVFKWWFDYNQGLAEATRLTREFTGLTGDRLLAVRNEIQATADTWGKEYKEVLDTVDTLMAQYGLTAEEAMTVIQDGFQAGADESGNMLSKVAELAPQFHDAGIAADEMMAIMAQTRSGIFSEGGMDLIAMASKKIREMASGTETALNGIGISAKQVQEDLESGAKSTFDVIQEVSARLRELPQDSQEVGNVLKDVFGRQGAAAGLQMIEQLDTMTTDIEKVKEVTGEYGESVRKQMETQKELNNVVSAMFDVTDKGFEEITVQAKTYITEGLIALLKWVVELTNKFIDLYNRSWAVRAPIQNIIGAVKVGWSVISNVFKAVFGVLKELINTLMGLGKIVHGVLSLDWDMIKEGAIEAGKGVGEAVAAVAKGVAGMVVDTVTAVVDAVRNTVKSADVPPITIPVTVDNPDIPDVNRPSGGTKPVKSDDGGGGGDSDKKKAAAAAKEREREEREEAKHQARMAKILADGEKRMLELITSNLARRRQAINVEYNNQIADLRNKLATEAKLTEDAKRSLNAQIIALEQEKQRKLQLFDEERVKTLADAKAKELDNEIKLIRENTQERLVLVQKQITEEYDSRRLVIDQKLKEQAEYITQMSADLAKATEEGRTEEEIAAIEQRMDVEQGIYDSYVEQRAQADEEQRQRLAEAQDEFDNAQIEKMQLTYQNQIDELMLKNDRTEEEGRRILELQREQAEEYLEMIENRGQMETQTTEEYNEQIIAAKQKLVEAEKSMQEYEAQIEQARMSAASSVTGGLVKLTNAIGQNNKEMAKLSKIITLAQIAIDTGKALSSGIASASSMPYPSNLVAIATTVGTVLTNIATAISTVNSAKFAHGGVAGLVNGKIDDDKDRLLVRVNKGEMILNDQQQQRLYKTLTGKDGDLTAAAQQELFGIADGTVEAPVAKVQPADDTEADRVESARAAAPKPADQQREVLDRMVSEKVEVALTEATEAMTVRVGTETMTLSEEQRRNVRKAFSEELRVYEDVVTRRLADGLYTLQAPDDGRDDDSTKPKPESPGKPTPVTVTDGSGRVLDFSPVTSAFSEIGGGVPVGSRQINDAVAAETGIIDQMAESIENMPAPVVSVEDINDGQRRVEVIENIDTL